jgi:hypothetical protein
MSSDSALSESNELNHFNDNGTTVKQLEISRRTLSSDSALSGYDRTIQR